MKTIPLFSPENDAYIYNNYSHASLKEKIVNKTALQKELNFVVSPNNFLIGIVIEMNSNQYNDLLIEIIEASIAIGIQVVVRGVGAKKYRTQLEVLMEKYPDYLGFVTDNEEYLHKLYAASDASIILNYTGENTNCLKNLCNYGVVSISVESKFLQDYDAIREQGNSFIIKELNLWQIFEAVIRAKENYKFPYDWKNLQLSCMHLFKG